MAIDTREKRQAVGSLKKRRSATVTPNASKDVEWRQEVAWGYPGIAPDSPAAPTPGVGGVNIRAAMAGRARVRHRGWQQWVMIPVRAVLGGG